MSLFQHHIILNPVLQYLSIYQITVYMFFSIPGFLDACKSGFSKKRKDYAGTAVLNTCIRLLNLDTWWYMC
jgi:hypothetical protein